MTDTMIAPVARPSLGLGLQLDEVVVPLRPGAGRRLAAKRLFDVIGAACLLVVLAPLMAVVALAIKLTSPGPVLFRQRRVGTRRSVLGATERWQLVPIEVLKFRSMVDGADERLHIEHIARYTNGTLEAHEGTFKLRDDPRVTAVGRVLRRTSLDELPQLVNVLRGEMSLVGPRPVPVYEAAGYERHHFARFAALPGLTGLWQVGGRADLPLEDMVRLDTETIERDSLWFDLRLLVRTLPAVVAGHGAG